MLLHNFPNLFTIQSSTGDVLPYSPNSVQKELHRLVDYQLRNSSKNRPAGKVRINIPKARQHGISTAIQQYALSVLLENPGYSGLTLADRLSNAVGLLKKFKFSFNNLDPELKAYYKVTRDNDSNFVFRDVGYDVDNLMIATTSGRSGTYNFAHFSELGKMGLQNTWDEAFAGTLPAVENADFIFYESSCEGGKFGRYYNFTMANEDEYSQIDNLFLPFYSNPSYRSTLPSSQDWLQEYANLAKSHGLYEEPVRLFGIDYEQLFWYFLKAKNYLRNGSVDDLRVAYPFTLEEAFVSKSTNAFNLSVLEDIKEYGREVVDVLDVPVRSATSSSIVNVSIPLYASVYNTVYSMGVDVASGYGQDYSAIVVRYYDHATHLFRQLVAYKGRVTPTQLKTVIYSIANRINQIGKCVITVENAGDAYYILDSLRHDYPIDLIYKRDYHPSSQLDTPIPKMGVATTAATRSPMIHSFSSLFNSYQLEVNSESEFEEIAAFVYNPARDRYEAAAGHHDDLIFSDIMSLEGFSYINSHYI